MTDTTKLTKITLHINTGDKKDNGDNKQIHAVLWNKRDKLEVLFGGVAEVVAGADGKSDLRILTKPVMVNGKEYQDPQIPMVVFVNRAHTGRIMSLSIKQGDKKVGELKFKKTFGTQTVLSGTYNANGLQFDSNFHVKAGVEGNRSMTANIVGGLKEEVMAAMIDGGTVQLRKAA